MHVHMGMAGVILEKPKRRAWSVQTLREKANRGAGGRLGARIPIPLEGPYVTLSPTNSCFNLALLCLTALLHSLACSLDMPL